MGKKTVLDIARLNKDTQVGMRRLTIDIPVELHSALRGLSVRFEIPMAEFVRQLLAEWLREQGALKPRTVHPPKLNKKQGPSG